MKKITTKGSAAARGEASVKITMDRMPLDVRLDPIVSPSILALEFPGFFHELERTMDLKKARNSGSHFEVIRRNPIYANRDSYVLRIALPRGISTRCMYFIINGYFISTSYTCLCYNIVLLAS
jgi:hypothetical protein